MNNILLLTDFSDDAKHAIFYGLTLFGDEGVRYKLVHSMYLPYSRVGAAASQVDVRTENARNAFEVFFEEIKTAFPDKNFDINAEVRCGEVIEVVFNLEKEKAIDLIIMGTRGNGGLATVLMGSNTISLMEQVSTPVLAIPKDYEYQRPEKIVLAMDNGKGPKAKTLDPMVQLAERFNAQVLVIHVAKEETNVEINYDKVNKILQSVRSHCVTVYDKDVSKGLERFVKSENVQMLCMIKQKLNFFERVFHRSLSNRMVLQTEVPMLVMGQKK